MTTQNTKTETSSNKVLRWGGLVTGILGAAGLIIFVCTVAFDWMLDLPEPLAWFDAIACGILLLSSIFVAWNWQGIGGVMLVASNIVVSAVHSVLSLKMEFGGLGILFFEIPASTLLLISGVLFLISWMLDRRRWVKNKLETNNS